MGEGPYGAAIERFPRLRQSMLAAFDRCALSTRFEQEYARDWSTPPQSRGTIFHRVAAECLKAMHQAGERQIPVGEAVAILNDVLRQDDVDRHCGICGAEAAFRADTQRVHCVNGHDHGSNFLNLPLQEIRDLRWVTIKFANENSFDVANLVDIEQRLLTTIEYPDGAGGHVERTLTGQLDALFIVGAEADHAIVLDWKDTWQLPAPTEVGFDGFFQQRFYAWLVMRNYPTVKRVTLRELYVRRSEAREADVWRGDLEAVEAELAALAERFDRAFATGNFPPTPGKHCHMCPLPMRCPIFSGVRVEGAITDPETAKKYTRELVAAKAAVKTREDALKAWIDVHGPETISDHKGQRVLGYAERKRTSRPSKEAVERALRAAGAGEAVDPDSLYRTSKVTIFGEFSPETTSDDEDNLDAQLKQSLEQAAAQRGR